VDYSHVALARMLPPGLEYGPLRTPPRRSFEDDDDSSWCAWVCCGCCAEVASKHGVLGRWWAWLKSSHQSPMALRQDAEAGGRSPGQSWRAAGKLRLTGWGLVLQRGATMLWVCLFFGVPLFTFFVGKHYVGDVPAGVSAAVLLQVLVLVFAICSAQSLGGSAAEPSSPRRQRKNR
jgi:hypothetical protein